MLCNYVKYMKAGIDLRHFGLKDLLILILWGRGIDNIGEQCLWVVGRRHGVAVEQLGLGFLANTSLFHRQAIQAAIAAEYVVRCGAERVLIKGLPILLNSNVVYESPECCCDFLSYTPWCQFVFSKNQIPLIIPFVMKI